MSRGRWLGGGTAAALGAAVAVAAEAATAVLNLPAPTIKNAAQICPGGVLSSTGLANWYWYNNTEVAKDFTSPEDLQRAFRNAPAERGARQQIVSNIETILRAWVNAPASGFRANLKPQQVDADDFLAGRAPTLVIRCAPPGAAAPTQTAAAGQRKPPSAAPNAATAPNGMEQSLAVQLATPAPAAPASPIEAEAAVPSGTSLASLENFRIRGAPDNLVVPRDTSAFTSLAGATFGFSDNGTNKTINNALKAALGYDLHFPSAYQIQHEPFSTGLVVDVIPFIAVDRNITTVAGKPAPTSRENVMTGLVGGLTDPFMIGEHPGSNLLSATVEHLWNDIDDSQLYYLHFVDQPVLNGFLNDYAFVPCCNVPVKQTWFAIEPMLDVRGDFGFYNDRGTDPAKNPDYAQIGSQFGFAISIDRLSSDITVTQTYLHDFDRSRKDISLFQAAWTYNILNKDVGLQASYENGNLEATAQRVQQWLISLSVKY